MYKRRSTLFAVAVVLVATLACSTLAVPAEHSITNALMAFDQEGDQPTTVFAPGNDFYVIFDLNNGVVGDVIDAKWYGELDVGTGPTYLFFEQNFQIEDEVSSVQEIYFQLYNEDGDWPVGPYKVELYLNGILAQTVAFDVR